MIPLPEIPYDPWFNEPHNPLDDMPIATNDRFDMYGSSDADDAYNPRPEEEIADLYASRHESSPEFEKTAEEVVTMHEKMYRIATAKYNPFAIGGSESIHDFEGGSERCQKK
tara:strand:- start:943 stop:1278 length:336 start_codon:yes stop_codon:yes gene_type:complete